MKFKIEYFDEIWGYLFQWNSIKNFFKTPLYKAVENENIEIIKLLLSANNIDINAINI